MHLDFEGGQIKVKLSYDGKYADASVGISVSLIEALKIAAAKTENKIDDSMVDMIAKLLEG